MRRALTKSGFIKSVLAMVLALILVLAMIPVDSIVAHAEDTTVSVSYIYPVYNTVNEPTSGIKEWKNGTQACIPITSTTTTLGATGTTSWYVVNSKEEANLVISGGLTVKGNVNIILEDGTKLTVNASDRKAGINVTGDNSLTIYGQSEGNGQLIAEAGNTGAGIGGNYAEDGGIITINGGEITAISNTSGAGIGGGSSGAGNDIIINGGSIIARSALNGAGIGGGAYKDGNNITINGGTITASGHNGAGIGGGFQGKGSNITINGGLVTASGDAFGEGIGSGGFGEKSNNIFIASGLTVKVGNSENSVNNITLNGTIADDQLSGKKYVIVFLAEHTHTFSEGWSSDESYHWHECTFEMATADCLLEAGAAKAKHDAWLNGKCVTCGYACTHDDKSEGSICGICGMNKVFSYMYPVYNTADKPTSGIKEWKNGTQTCILITSTTTTLGATGTTSWYVVNSKEEANLVISGGLTVKGNVNIILADGAKLTVNASDEKAGINVTGDNSLTIYGQSEGNGQLIAKAGANGAGIGGGESENGSNITINGGAVTVTGGDCGAGIGGGCFGNGTHITINGGSVTATSVNGGAGIGGGHYNYGSNITINGGAVNVTGGDGAAGIGGGDYGNGSNITVNGGTVTATGGDSGAGIGGGFRDEDVAEYDDNLSGRGEYITINGGTVTATGGDGGSGIGGGDYGNGSNITVNGGTVTATGGEYGSGIGGGDYANGSNITVNGGTVTATGGKYGSGIGGGDYGNGSNITINPEYYVRVGNNKDSATAVTLEGTDWARKLYKTAYVFMDYFGAVYSGCSLSLTGDIGINILMKIGEVALDSSDVKMVVSFKDTVTEIPLEAAKGVAPDKAPEGFSDYFAENASDDEAYSDYYMFSYSVPAKDYCQEIKCQLVCGGKEGNIVKVKVSDYIDAIQNNSSKYSKNTVNLANAMEKYCAAASSYFAVDAQTGAGSQESQTEQYDYLKIAGELGEFKTDVSKMGEGYLGSSLVLNGKVAIRHYYSDKAVFDKIGVSDYEAAGDIYYYEISDISPANYDVGQSKGYTVYSYIEGCLSGNGCSYSLMNLLCAMYEYGEAADAM